LAASVATDLRVYGRADGLPAPAAAAAILVDKPAGWTSFDVIAKLRRPLNWMSTSAAGDGSGQRGRGKLRMGHAGTLDPMATGLLILLVGREATRYQDRFMGLPKVYTGTFRLGETTPSFDADTPVDHRRDASGVTDEALRVAASALTGEIAQRPPAFSAVKVGGERLYRKARRGEEVDIAARPVTIYSFDIKARRGADVDFRVECTKGTYVRSLARDLGEALGTGAHLVALRREAIGPFRVDEAWALDSLVTAALERSA
jgi:tRNA pseudouridine55 synthase